MREQDMNENADELLRIIREFRSLGLTRDGKYFAEDVRPLIRQVASVAENLKQEDVTEP